MNEARPKAVILLSGGLDSAVTGAIARQRGFALNALTFRYGQRHEIETRAAAAVARSIGIERHVWQSIDLRVFGGSALTDDIEVPKSGDVASIGQGVPPTYVPARNTIFLSFALAFAETIGARDIFIGVNAIDFSGYPDCRPAFIEAFQRLADLGTRAGAGGAGFTIHTPLMQLSKTGIIREGLRLGVDFSLTHSCYDPTPRGVACGCCDACLLRRQGFAQAGIHDPIHYAGDEPPAPDGVAVGHG
jgi:7-cyano-7-deazaguanine synthase